MSYSSGTFSINSTGQPVVTGTTISSSVFNSLTADLATGLSTCVLKDGTQTITANIPTAGFKFTGLGAGSAAGDSLRYEQLFSTSAVALLGAMDWFKGANIASGATVNLTTATGNAVHITGTTTITAVTLGSGLWRLVIFDGALTLTHHTTNNNLPGAGNITTAADDRALYWSDGTTVYCMAYVRATATPLAYATQAIQEAGTSTTDTVTTAVQQYHQSAAKGWVQCDFAGATAGAYNVTSITDTGAGDATVVWATDFSSANYATVASSRSSPGGTSASTFVVELVSSAYAVGSTQVLAVRLSDFSAQDASYLEVIAFGDQ